VGAAATTALDRTADDGHDDDHRSGHHDDHGAAHNHGHRPGDHDDVPDRTAGTTGTADYNDDGGRL
jgi:hypothetical protein